MATAAGLRVRLQCDPHGHSGWEKVSLGTTPAGRRRNSDRVTRKCGQSDFMFLLPFTQVRRFATQVRGNMPTRGLDSGDVPFTDPSGAAALEQLQQIFISFSIGKK
jgi:hypothetical protein